jgi:hypothetical protein
MSCSSCSFILDVEAIIGVWNVLESRVKHTGTDFPIPNTRLSRDGEARPTPGRRGAPRPDGRKVPTNEPTSGKVPTGTVGHSSETTSGTTNETTIGTTSETNIETASETNQRTTEIESGSIVSAHKFGQSKPVSIGGCKRNYNHCSDPLHLPFYVCTPSVLVPIPTDSSVNRLTPRRNVSIVTPNHLPC